MNKKKCELYDRDCINCGECEFCDIDPLKICDNCGKCVEMGDVFSIKIDGISNADGETIKFETKKTKVSSLKNSKSWRINK